MAEPANTGLVDYNTGQPVGQGNLNFVQGQGTYNSGTSGTSTTQQSGGTTSSSKASNSINTTQTALDALNTLIKQLSSHSSVSNTDLDAVAPLLIPQAGKYGIVQRNAPNPVPGAPDIPVYGSIPVYYDPKTGQTVEGDAATRLLAERQAMRAQISAAAPQTEGTPQQQLQNKERQTEIVRNRTEQDKYSPEAAKADAQALMNQALDNAMRTLLPQITSASDSSGTSKSSMRALLTQNVGIRGATEGAALGANLATAYGGIDVNLANTLEALTRSDPNSPAAMLANLLIGSKGIVSSGVETGSQTTSPSSSTTTQTTAPTSQGQLTTRGPNNTPQIQTPNTVPVPSIQGSESSTGRVFEDDPSFPGVLSGSYNALFSPGPG